jgi:hypothetical protein
MPDKTNEEKILEGLRQVYAQNQKILAILNEWSVVKLQMLGGVKKDNLEEVAKEVGFI